MIDRRFLLGALAALPVAAASAAQPAATPPGAAALPVPAGGRLAFHIIREGNVIGEHNLSFATVGDALTVTVAVDIRVGVGPIALFRYTHRATEQWRNGSVVTVNARTDDDGTDLEMNARHQGGGLFVAGSQTASYLAPAHSLPATHWNRAMLDGPLINTQNGKLMRPSVTMVGMEPIKVGAGTVQAQHFRLRGDADLDTWYDMTPSWVALRFAAKDGSEIRYQRAS